MPDQNMPYYNDPGQQQQFGQNIPNPSQQMMDYSYLQNNQQIMYNGQSNVANTMRIAQDNFHRDMSNVLQGTMAAGMAIYNTGKSAVDKAKETQYQDMLLGGGNYVLERGFMREAAWASGLAQTDFGRAMKIGGRRPEFMSQQELEMQMERSWHHRVDELGIQAGGGAVAVGSSLLGMGLTGGFGGLLKPMGLVKGSLVGMALDQTLGRAYDVGYAQPKEYRNEFRKISEITNLHGGVGQRRLGAGTSDELIDRFYEEERKPMARLIPFVGDFIADRMAPDTKASEFIPKMMQAGLFRGHDLGDVDKLEKYIKDTVKFVEKFAGIANITKDAVLGLKGKLESQGLNGSAQDATVANITKTMLSTGLDFGSVAGMSGSFQQLGLLTGQNKLVTARSGLVELSQIKALQEAGLIDRELDAGSLSFRNTQRAIDYGKTGSGQVGYYGKGDLGRTKQFYADNGGGGDAGAGYFLNTGGLNDYGIDNNQAFTDRAKQLYAENMKRTKNSRRALAQTMAQMGIQAGDREGMLQVEKAVMMDEIGKNNSNIQAQQSLYEKSGRLGLPSVFSINSVKDQGQLWGGSGERVSTVESFGNALKELNSTSNYNDNNSKYKDFKEDRLNREGVEKIYGHLYSKNYTEYNNSKKALVDKLVKTGEYTQEEAERSIYSMMSEFDKSNKSTHLNDLGIWPSDDDKSVSFIKKRNSIESIFKDSKDGVVDPRGLSKIALSNVKRIGDFGYSYVKEFNQLFKDSKYGPAMKNFYDHVDTNSSANNSALNAKLLKDLKDAGAPEELLSALVGADSNNPEALKFLMANAVKTKQESKSALDATGIDNVFSTFSSRKNSKYGEGKEINREKYGSLANDLSSTIKNLKGLSYKEAQTWLHDHKDAFTKILGEVHGNDKLGQEYFNLFNDSAWAGKDKYEKLFDKEFIKDIKVGAGDQVSKELETLNDPALIAISKFTVAIETFTSALTG